MSFDMLNILPATLAIQGKSQKIQQQSNIRQIAYTPSKPKVGCQLEWKLWFNLWVDLYDSLK